MSGRSSLAASAEQQAARRELAGSAVRGEAGEIAMRFARDRALAVLLTLAGWTAGRIGEAFGVGEDSVRRWRHWFAQGGVTRWARRWRLVLLPSTTSGHSPARASC